jgi:hypothetical protein
LKKLGFEAIVSPRVAKVLTGWIPFEKLNDLTALPSVRRVVPHRGI